MSRFQTLSKGGVTYRDEPWHKECFVCTNCKTQLAGQHFTSRDDSPYCLKCFGNLYAKKCEACAKPITGKMTSLAIMFLLFSTVIKPTQGGCTLVPQVHSCCFVLQYSFLNESQRKGC